MDNGLHELTPAYALDAIDGEERERYEAHLAGCEHCREELGGFWRVSGALARGAGGPSPAPALRERILTQARAERPNVVPFRRRVALPAAASIAAVAAVAAIGLGLWATSLSRQLDDVRAAGAGQADAVAVLSDPRARSVPFSGADGHLVVSSTGMAAMVLTGLDRAPEGKTYEIWVIEAGTARPAGLFAGAGTRTVLPLERPVPENAIVAVTLERKGGVSVPSGSPLFQTRAV